MGDPLSFNHKRQGLTTVPMAQVMLTVARLPRPVMVSVLLAFSLDYSLFMLSRFMENKGKAMDT